MRTYLTYILKTKGSIFQGLEGSQGVFRSMRCEMSGAVRIVRRGEKRGMQGAGREGESVPRRRGRLPEDW
jgi:hypothetical protein